MELVLDILGSVASPLWHAAPKMLEVRHAKGILQMFRDDTVFIIGAGASHEFDFPVGSALMDIIRDKSRFRFDHTISEGDRHLFHWLQQRYPSTDDQNDRLLALGEINRAIDSAGSIDEFIARNQHDPLIAEMGKIQIAYAIAKAEADSKVMKTGIEHDRTINWNALKNTWIDRFAYALFNGVRTTDVGTLGDNITIICFNYDRCIEFYLANAIHRAFKEVDLDHATEIVNAINIIHPYGTLGELPTKRTGHSAQHVAFGSQLTADRLWTMSENILTFSESLRDAEIKARIDRAIFEAERLVFLGFSFARQNMNLLASSQIDQDDFEDREAFATAFGFKQQVVGSLKRNISDLYATGTLSPERVHIDLDWKCNDFIHTHLLNLMQ